MTTWSSKHEIWWGKKSGDCLQSVCIISKLVTVLLVALDTLARRLWIRKGRETVAMWKCAFSKATSPTEWTLKAYFWLVFEKWVTCLLRCICNQLYQYRGMKNYRGQDFVYSRSMQYGTAFVVGIVETSTEKLLCNQSLHWYFKIV